MGHGCDAHKRIGGADARANRLTIGMRLKTIAQECGIALIDFVEASDRRRGSGKGFRRDALRGQDAQWSCSTGYPDHLCVLPLPEENSTIQLCDVNFATLPRFVVPSPSRAFLTWRDLGGNGTDKKLFYDLCSQ